MLKIPTFLEQKCAFSGRSNWVLRSAAVLTKLMPCYESWSELAVPENLTTNMEEAF